MSGHWGAYDPLRYKTAWKNDDMAADALNDGEIGEIGGYIGVETEPWRSQLRVRGATHIYTQLSSWLMRRPKAPKAPIAPKALTRCCSMLLEESGSWQLVLLSIVTITKYREYYTNR